MILLIIGLILFIGLVVVHELGHFLVARRNGVVAEEFGIFFPPRLYSRKMKGGWLFSINLLPLGGFVKLKGEHDTDTAKGTYGAASLWAKTQIMAAGVVMNLLVAVVLLTIIALLGMPKLVDNQFTVKSDTKIVKNEIIIGDVEPGSPALKAGIKQGDLISGAWTGNTNAGQHCTYPELNGTPNLDDLCPAAPPYTAFRTTNQLTAFTKQYAGQKVVLLVARGGNKYVTDVQLRTTAEIAASQNTNNPKGYLGVYPSSYTLQRSTWSAPIVALGLTKQFTVLTFEGLGKAVAGLGSTIAGALTGNTAARQHGQTSASRQVSGPVGIFVILKDGSLLGYQFMLLIIAVISLTLAIMNILPIPALDGGRLWLTLISRGLFKKPLPARREELINGIGFAFLMLLIVLITVVDVKRFF